MTSSTPSILITGGAGFIGSHTAWLLAEYFHLVLVDDFSAHADAQANLLALDLLLSNKLKPHTPRILNCGSGQGLSVKEIIQTTENITKKSLPVQEAQPRPGDVACIVADISRIQQVLNWKPSLSKLSLMIEHTIHWEKQLLSKQKPARN